MKHVNSFVLSALLLCCGSMAFGQSQLTHWVADGMNVDFSGSTPQYNTTNQTVTSSYPVSIGGWTDPNGNLLFSFLRSTPPVNLPIIRKYVNNVAAGDVNFWPTAGSLDWSDNLGGEVNIIPFPGQACAGGHPDDFLIIYNRAELLNPQSNHMEFVVYNYTNNTISTPKSLSPTISSAKLMGSAVSKIAYDAAGQHRFLYFVADNIIYRARIDFNAANGWFVEQNPTALFTVPGVTTQDVMELELNHQGDRLAWIIKEDNYVRSLDLNTLTLSTWLLGDPSFADLTGLEWTPGGDMLFVNRDVPGVYSWLSGIMKWNVVTGWQNYTGMNRQWTHSQIELAHDGFMYVTNGNDLLRINATTGSPGTSYAYPVAQTPVRTFRYGYTNYNNTYGTPTGHENYRFPDQVDGEEMYPTIGNGGFVMPTVYCADMDPVNTPSDIHGALIQLYNPSFQLLREEWVSGGSSFDVEETFPEIVCGSSQYLFTYTVYPLCGTSYGSHVPFFSMACSVTPTVSVGSCISNPVLVTATNYPGAGTTINWYNDQNALLATGVTQLYLASGDYTLEYVMGSCTNTTEFSVNCGKQTIEPIGLGMRPELGGEVMTSLDLTLYPNPAKDEITLPAALSGDDDAIAAYDMSGRMMRVVRSGNTISVRGWEPGMYLFVLKGEDGASQRQRVMVIE